MSRNSAHAVDRFSSFNSFVLFSSFSSAISDAVLAQLPDGQLHLGNVAEETIEGGQSDCIRFDWMQSAD